MSENPRAPQQDRLRCPKCGCAHLPVYKTRQATNCIYRYRRCRHCGNRMTSRERIVSDG